VSTKVKWTTSFPAHWDIVPAKRLFPESKTRAAEEDEQLSATQSYGVISQSEFMHLAGRKVVQLNTNQHLRKRVEIGDFVISMRSFQGGLERAWAAGGIRSSYVVLKPHPNLNIGYYQYFFKSTEYIQALQSTANFIRDGQDMSYQDFILIDLPLPPYNEQKIIAAFLNYEISRIDKLVAKQQQLIELLKEKRQSVISHAVTKGLNPDVPMKDSGVEWLGEIPTHWEMKRLAYLGSARNGLTYSPEHITDQESGVLVLRSSNIQNSSLCFDDNVYVDSIIPEQFLVKENDLLICSRNGSRNLIGKNALISKDAEGMAFGAFMAIFRSPLNTYIFWVLNSPLFDYQSGSFLTSTINQLTIGNLNSMEIPVPTLKEQKEIAQYLSRKNDDFIALINKVKDSITLLQERRTALISAAVTGKIDVRDWVAPDTQNVEEPQEATA